MLSLYIPYPAQKQDHAPPFVGIGMPFLARHLLSLFILSLAFICSMFHESVCSAVPIPHHANSTDKHITHEAGQRYKAPYGTQRAYHPLCMLLARRQRSAIILCCASLIDTGVELNSLLLYKSNDDNRYVIL